MSSARSNATARAGRLRWGLRKRVIVYTSALMCAALGAAFTWSVHNLRLVLEARNDMFLRHELDEFRELVSTELRTRSPAELSEELGRESQGIEEAGMYLAIRHGGITEVYPETPEASELAGRLEVAPLAENPRTVETGASGTRALRGIVSVPGGDDWIIDIGLDLAETDRTVASFVSRLIGGGALLMVAAVLGSLFLMQQAVQPIAAGIRTAQRLNPDDLSARLPRTGAGDEVDSLAATINDLLERLSRYHERVIRFTADASHELRGPLAAMRAAVDVALHQPRPAEEYREALGALGEQCQRLTDLVNKLLLLAQADAGQVELLREPVDLEDVLAEAVETYRPLAEEKQVELSLKTSGTAWCRGDRMRLRQLVMNLLDNAIKFTAPGGNVAAALTAQEVTSCVTIEDTGIGIAAERLEHIFERFYQADESRTANGGGLGLSICRWVASAHGGTIEVASRPGHGTRFTVTLPTSSA